MPAKAELASDALWNIASAARLGPLGVGEASYARSLMDIAHFGAGDNDTGSVALRYGCAVIDDGSTALQ